MYRGFALLDHSLLLMDIHVMIVIDSCQKNVSADQCHLTVSRAQVYNSFTSKPQSEMSL